MVEIVSLFAGNLGALISNLINRDYIVRMNREKGVISGSVIILQITNMDGKPKTLREAITEREIEAIQDIGVIADALVEKLRKS